MALWILSGTTRVSRYQKGKTKTNLDFLKQETVSGSGISWALCKSAPRPRQVTMYIMIQKGDVNSVTFIKRFIGCTIVKFVFIVVTGWFHQIFPWQCWKDWSACKYDFFASLMLNCHVLMQLYYNVILHFYCAYNSSGLCLSQCSFLWRWMKILICNPVQMVV